MATVEIEILGRRHLVGCEDGQEARLRDVAKSLDAQARALGGESLPEARLFLMLALTASDELADARGRVQSLDAALRAEDPAAAAQLERAAAQDASSAEMARTLDEIAARLERLAAELRGDD